MDKLKYVKLENEDGSYSSSIPLAVDSDYVDVNGNTLTSVLENTATKAEVQALASGGPAGVYSTVAALTSADPDHSKIYLVTQNGHWYYYNNGWQDGGMYQAAEDGKTVGILSTDVLNHDYQLRLTLDTELGGFSGQVDLRVEDTRTDRLRTEYLETLNKKGTVWLSDCVNWTFGIYRQNKTTGEISSNGYTDSWTENFSNDYYYRFLLKKRDNTSPTANDTYPNVYIYFEDNILEPVIWKEGFNYDRLSIGIFSGSDISADVAKDTRLRSPVLTFKKEGTLRTKIIDSNLVASLYSEKNGVVTNVVATDASISIEPNVEYRFLIRGKNQDYDFTDNYPTPFNEILNIKWYDKESTELDIRVDALETKTDNLLDYEKIIKSNANNILRQSYNNKFAFKDLDDGYISIGFDDGNYDVNDAIEYCHTQGVPCYYAIIPDRATGNVETMVSNLLSYGGEICSHNGTVITPEVQANPTQMFNLFFNTKYTLENQFNTRIHGIIQAGGTGQNTEDKDLDEEWSRCAGYEYSDYYGVNTPYHLGRRNLTRFTHEQQVTELQRAKTNHEWQIWFCHHVDGQEKNSYPEGYTLNDFKWFVDKALELDLNIVIPYYVISNFGTTELEKRIKALEDASN